MTTYHLSCFRWRKPRLYVYRAGDPVRLGARINKYAGHRPIGIALQVNGRVFSLTWATLGGPR